MCPRVLCNICAFYFHTRANLVNHGEIVPILLLVLLLRHLEVGAHNGDRGASGSESVRQARKGLVRVLIQGRHTFRSYRTLSKEDVTRKHTQFEVVRATIDMFDTFGELLAHVFEVVREALDIDMT